MKPMGRNTADRTSAIPTSAPLIWPMLFSVAATGSRPSSRITRSTFSTTTMASSTKSPMARTMANMVRVLIEYPSAASMAKVPSSTTGIAMIGISVARQFCKNSKMTRNTSAMASSSV